MHAQVLLVGATEQQLQSTECRDGVTPPMRDARRRIFAPTPVLDPDRMRKLEEDLLTIAMVCAVPRSGLLHMTLTDRLPCVAPLHQ